MDLLFIDLLFPSSKVTMLPKLDRSSSISQVHAFNVTDSCYRMTRKLNESNVGWQSSTQASILEYGWIDILCSKNSMHSILMGIVYERSKKKLYRSVFFFFF